MTTLNTAPPPHASSFLACGGFYNRESVIQLGKRKGLISLAKPSLLPHPWSLGFWMPTRSLGRFQQLCSSTHPHSSKELQTASSAKASSSLPRREGCMRVPTSLPHLLPLQTSSSKTNTSSTIAQKIKAGHFLYEQKIKNHLEQGEGHTNNPLHYLIEDLGDNMFIQDGDIGDIVGHCCPSQGIHDSELFGHQAVGLEPVFRGHVCRAKNTRP